jgi:hypothetical protein
MSDNENCSPPNKRTPWNKGELIGARPPLRPKHVWSIRTRLLLEGRIRDLALFNLAIRATVRQKKTGRPVKFELTDQTRQAIDDCLRLRPRSRENFYSRVGAAPATA